MPQARGTQFVLGITDETTFGSDPTTPALKRLHVKTCGVQSSQALLDSEVLTTERSPTAPDLGNIDVAGAITTELNAESLCRILKHALGTTVTGRPISQQPTNVTGVVAEYAETGAATGNGTLSFVASGTTLAWAANGDTAGSAVDVSAGGTFQLESNTASQALIVTVTAGSLPGTDQSDSNITVVDAYEHRFTIGNLPVGMLLEKDYGANISGTGRFEKFNGCRVSALRINAPQEGYPEVSIDVRGAKSTLGSATVDAAAGLDDDGHTSFSAFAAGTVEEGGSAIAVLTGAEITVDNDLDDTGYVLGTGQRAQLPEGFARIGGQVTALFDSAALLNKAIAGTETSLRLVFSRGTGVGTAGNELVEVLVQQMKYERASPPIEGPRGVLITLPFKGYRSGTDAGLLIKVRNQIGSL